MTVVMVVIAMLVVMVITGVIVVAMIVRRMIVRGVGMAAAGIGAALGIERRLDLDDACAEPLHHRLDDVVAPDPQALWHDLGWQMTIAEMPADPHQVLRIVAANLDQRLRRRHHLDEASILQHQRVTAAQRYRVFEIEQEFEPARAGHHHPPPVPIVEIEHDGIGRCFLPVMLAFDLRRTNHV